MCPQRAVRRAALRHPSGCPTRQASRDRATPVLGLPLDDAGHVIAELASNAALHGYVPGRDFRIMLSVTGDTLRIEVADARGDVLPRVPERNDDSEAGRGLMLVEAIAIRWGVQVGPYPRKTVWAEVALTGS
ncbi:ATP-binding protein [Streptomyces sp. NPDC087849]|uniref:ATP-binding protein n=1 Tax=Streptomyces sp. NPDC087849 TaxID=3365808 RepID=UPI0037FEBB02